MSSEREKMDDTSRRLDRDELDVPLFGASMSNFSASDDAWDGKTIDDGPELIPPALGKNQADAPPVLKREIPDPYAMQREQKREAQKRMRRKSTRSTIVTFAIALFLAIMMRMFVIEVSQVSGSSMLPTLHDKQRLLVSKLAYQLGGDPKRFDIVVCNIQSVDENYVKRVIALPGERVAVKGGKVYVGGSELKDDVYNGIIADDFDEVKVPDGSIFVLGDNRNESEDSRYSRVGFIPYDHVVGKVVAIVWPLGEIRLTP